MLLTAHAVGEEDSLCPKWGWSAEGPLLELLAPVPEKAGKAQVKTLGGLNSAHATSTSECSNGAQERGKSLSSLHCD